MVRLLLILIITLFALGAVYHDYKSTFQAKTKKKDLAIPKIPSISEIWNRTAKIPNLQPDALWRKNFKADTERKDNTTALPQKQQIYVKQLNHRQVQIDSKKISLLGTVGGSYGLAIFSINGKIQFVRIGENVVPGVKLLKIENHRIILEIPNTEKFTLSLFKFPSNSD